MDGKPMPFSAHSPLQTSWLTLIWAPPGSGKSVMMNAMNLDFAAFYRGANLPFIGAMDVGESSRGFIDMLKASLRPAEQHLVQYVRLKNEVEARQYRVNPFDLGLGRRAPLKREQSFVQNVLLAMIWVDDPLLTALVENIVTNVYQRGSDMEVTSSCKVWQPAKDPEIDRRAEELGIALHEDLTWWSMTDQFAARGEFAMAERAQRFAHRQREAAAPEHDQIRPRRGHPLQIHAVGARHARDGAGRRRLVGKLGGSDDAAAGTDGKQLLDQVRGEGDDALRRLPQCDRLAGVVDDGQRRLGAAHQPRAAQRGKSHLPAAASTGSVTKPIRVSPDFCAAAITCASRS
jgi:hypothetical protein